jgi:solute carrier family 25 folate transporter 32
MTDGPNPPPNDVQSQPGHDAPRLLDGRAEDPPPPLPRDLGSPFSTLAVRCAAIPNSTVNALCGAAAGIASGVVTCPLDVIKTRLQAQGSFRPRSHEKPTRAVYNGLMGTARVIWSHDGFRGMYRGLGPMLLGYIPTWAVYMSVYDSSKEIFGAQTGLCMDISTSPD